MSKRNSTVEIKDGKVVFSKEILEYFKSIRNEENGIWIDKYFKYLSNEENLTAEKYNGHHIIPCFVFKDETHKNRKETEPLADKVEGNIIKISVYNHLLAHYCLWKIYNNRDSKTTIQRMCKENIDSLSENEIKEIAKIQEECTKKNQTKEEYKERKRKYYENDKEKISKRGKQYKENNKEKLAKQRKQYKEKNKEKISKDRKIYYEQNKEKISKKQKESYQENKDKILNKRKEFYKNNKERLSMERKSHNSLLCYDPKEHDFCTLGALNNRKARNKEKYKDVKQSSCIIQTSTPST